MKYLDVAEYVKEKQVSVPYWGSLYFNSIKDSIRIFTITVSVPYWGSLYFNKGKKTYEEEMTSFRPLLGFFIFQSLSVAHDNNEIIAVSVPYWGSLYFNRNRIKRFIRNAEKSFRPLLGFFIFQ